MFQGVPQILQQTDPDYISPYRAKQAQEIMQELRDMDIQLKIWQMVIDFLGSGDFLAIIFVVFLGIMMVKSVGVFDRWLERRNKED